VRADYIVRLRHLVEMVRKLEAADQSPEIEQELARLEQDLREAATQVTLDAFRQEVERRRGPQERRQVTVPVAFERRVSPIRRVTDMNPDRSGNR